MAEKVKAKKGAKKAGSGSPLKPEISKLKQWLTKEHPGPDNTKLDVCHLWNRFYRLNYWKKKAIGNLESYCIVNSRFVKIMENKTGFSIIFYDN